MAPVKRKQRNQDSKVAFDPKNNELTMATSSKPIPTSKTLDSIASLPKVDPDNLVEFKRSEVLLMAKSDAEGSNGDFLIAGLLTVQRKNAFQGPILEWIPQEQPDNSASSNSESQYGASFSDREWTMITDQLSKRNVRPIEFELCELKSFRLSDDGNRLVLIQRDGTRHPPLIFLDEGAEELINVFRR